MTQMLSMQLQTYSARNEKPSPPLNNTSKNRVLPNLIPIAPRKQTDESLLPKDKPANPTHETAAYENLFNLMMTHATDDNASRPKTSIPFDILCRLYSMQMSADAITLDESKLFELIESDFGVLSCYESDF